MPVEKAKPEFYELLALVCEDNRPDVSELKIKIGVVFAHAATNDQGIKTGPALTKGGYEVAWAGKVTSVDERLTGSPDLRVKINGDQWDEEWSEGRRLSVLDEILHAITIARDPDTDDPLLDDAMRPRIRLKPFDINVQGYELVVRRHGSASICSAALDAVNDRLRQKTMFD